MLKLMYREEALRKLMSFERYLRRECHLSAHKAISITRRVRSVFLKPYWIAKPVKSRKIIEFPQPVEKSSPDGKAS